MSDNRSIGIFDSGLGGLTVAKEIMNCMPNEDIVYFGDTGRVPYGNRSRDTIKKYAAQDEKFLLSHNVKLIIAACGTVSSVASEEAKLLPVPYFEMVSYAAFSAVKATRNNKIGVIGTSATILSEAHKREILKLNPEIKVLTNACPLFVPLVEEGWHSHNDVVVTETVKRYLKPIITAECDTIILGCTHYPVLEDAIKQVVGDSVTLINPGIAVANAVADYLKNNSLENSKSTEGQHSYFVSDKPDSFKVLASVLLGNEIDDKKVKQVDLNNL